MKQVKLSELPDDQKLFALDTSYFVDASEIKNGTTGLDVSRYDWYTAVPASWVPDAKYMIENYLDGEADEKYEEWYERALDCLTKDDFKKIQDVLEEAFNRDNGVVRFWESGEEVILDSLPSMAGESK